MHNAAAMAYANRAGQAWGGFSQDPVIIRNRENIVMKAHLASGQTVAVRLHRVGYQSRQSILSELVWTQALATAGFPCPLPVAAQNGDMTWQGNGPLVSVIDWLDAECIGESGANYAGTETDHCDLYHRIGGLMADLHTTTDALDLPQQPRPQWSAEGLLGDTPWWGKFWENPSLDSVEQQLLNTTRQACLAYLPPEADADYGLIHADLLQENILQNADGLWVIDFDDSGYGYRPYDLGAALVQHAECPYLPSLRAALIEGYVSKRGAIVSDLDIQVFMMLRAFASTGWIISRAAPDNPKQRFYCDRALTLAREIRL
ncbi:phosphotransferase enzyme family protein [Algirhabdus cladophorae]|uniref:phosphotransferase enzyme family protein n=1 Tax=Algirhabdus cladophorae TaxID=3377108 RepID=UPI003B8481B5